jgi:hypothetical protein
MDTNKIKINYNSSAQTAAYQFLSDNGQWVDVDKNSELSRKKYVTAIKDGRIVELLSIIDKTYNIDGCGVEIAFTGEKDAFSKIKDVIDDGFTAIFLSCTESKNVIVGKRNSGKTYLAEAIISYLGKKPRIEENDKYIKYFDPEDAVTLYEIKGIDLGLDNVDKAYEVLKSCIEDGAKTVFYCFQATTGKIENPEIDFIYRVEKSYPEISIVPVITACVDEGKGNEFAHKIVDEIGKKDVLITLAKEKNTRVGMIPAYGIEQVIKKLDGGIT